MEKMSGSCLQNSTLSSIISIVPNILEQVNKYKYYIYFSIIEPIGCFILYILTVDIWLVFCMKGVLSWDECTVYYSRQCARTAHVPWDKATSDYTSALAVRHVLENKGNIFSPRLEKGVISTLLHGKVFPRHQFRHGNILIGFIKESPMCNLFSSGTTWNEK